MKVLTHTDVPNNWYTILKLINVGYDDEPVLAEDKVLYRGEPIVAVVATTERAALEGAAAVKVTYEDLEPVFDVEEAIEDGAPVLKPHGTNYFVYEDHHCRRIRFGDVEAGFAEADHIFEWRYQSRADRARADRDHGLHRRSRRATGGCRSTPTRRPRSSRSTTRR